MQKTIFFLPLFCLLLWSNSIAAQSVFVPINHYHHQFIQRLEIKSGKSAQSFHYILKPLERRAMIDFLISTDSTVRNLSYTDRQLIASIRQANSEWDISTQDTSERPVKRHFYRNPHHFYLYHDEDLFLSVNPVIHFDVGRENEQDLWLYQNTRGVEVRGMINKKVGFYSYVADNQARFPWYVNNKIQQQKGAVPGEGWNIPFGVKGYDYFTARGYITFQATKNIGLQFGQDKNAVGYGQRSLLLSDYANNYLFLKINTKLWRFHYQNIFARLVDYPHRTYGGRMYDPKYMVAHTLSFNVSNTFQLALFESVVFGRSDTISKRYFDLHYLNPVIFYRAVEHHTGDTDKVSLGMTFRWIAGKSIAVHGQVYIDDFLLSDIRNDIDSSLVYLGIRRERKYNDYASFRNKFATQIGIDYIDVFGIDNLDMFVERNWVRPFTYTHYDTSGAGMAPAASYTHYGQALAHPLGANFKEILFGLKYQPHHDWLLIASLISARQGMDSAGINMGGNIFLDYTTRAGDYGHTILQGELRESLLFQGDISWQWHEGMWLDFRYLMRREEFQQVTNNSGIFMLGIRINAVQKQHWF